MNIYIYRFINIINIMINIQLKNIDTYDILNYFLVKASLP